MPTKKTPRLSEARDLIARVARTVLRVANSTDVTKTPAPTQKWDFVTKMRYEAGGDAVEIESGHEKLIVDAYVAGRRLPIGLAVAETICSHAWDQSPTVLIDAMRQLLAVIEAPSLTDGRLDIPWSQDARAWHAAAGECAELARGNPGTTIRIMQDHNRVNLKVAGAKGCAPSPAATMMVSALPPMAFLSWEDQSSPQALAKRRDHDVPPMGRALIARSPLNWTTDTPVKARPDLRSSPVAILRSSLTLASVPEIEPKERFTWTLQNFHGFDRFVRETSEVRSLLIDIVRLNDNTTAYPPELVKRGSRWTDIGVRRSDRFALRTEELAILARRGYFKCDDEAEEETYVGSYGFHEILEAMAGAGHASLQGVSDIAAQELVPQGVPANDQARLYGTGYHTVQLTPGGYESRHQWAQYEWPLDPPARAQEPSGDQLRAVQVDDMVYPDHGELVVLPDRGLATSIDPSHDKRNLRGPLAELYRMPVADRVLVMRHVLASRMVDALRSFEDWGE